MASIYEARHLGSDSPTIYHDELDHDSNSSLRLFEKHPMRYKLERVDKRIPRKKQTNPQKLGSLDHITIIERDRVAEKVKVIPKDVLSSDGKAGVTNDYKLWRTANPGFEIYCKQEELDASLLKSDCVLAHPEARKLIELSELREYDIFWRYDGVYPVKCKIDLGSEMFRHVVDVKNISGDPDEFWRSIQEYGMIGQPPLYLDGYYALFGHPAEYRYIIISEYDVCVRKLPQAALDAGRRRNAETLAKLAACKRGERPWLRDDLQTVEELRIPEFMLNEADDSAAELVEEGGDGERY